MPLTRLLRAPTRWSVTRQVFVLQVLVGLLVVVVGVAAGYVQAGRASTQEATARARAVAETVASSPDVVAGVRAGDSSSLQRFAEEARVETRTDFVVVMSPDGIRFTHPDTSQIGRRFIGHIEAAQRGGVVVEDYTGTLGPSRRVVVPVEDGGAVVGLVAVGIRKSAVTAELRSQLPGILLAGLAAALLTGLGTALVSRRVRRQTHGLGERQLRQMVEYYDAVLHAVTEGLLLVDLDGTLRLANDEAVRLLGLPPDAVGRRVPELGLPDTLVAALTDDRAREDELHVTDARVLVLNKARAQWDGRLLGFVVTLRDRTDLEHLTGELDSARGLTEALRSQAHESANRLHAIVSLIELGHPERALAFATDELRVSQGLTDAVVGAVSEPVLTALLLGKVAQASQSGIELVIADGAQWPAQAAPDRDLVTIVGNLIDNAFEAVAGTDGPRRVTVDCRAEGDEVVLVVEDTGPGLPPGSVDDAFRRGFTTKEEGSAGRRGIGLALVAQSVARLGGRLEVSGPPGARFEVRIPVQENARA
ncbi:MAG TPA: sensor histidine kinase [Pedococcus sp.]|nr:sensor histidine kinase [Pedococcus sp.]